VPVAGASRGWIWAVVGIGAAVIVAVSVALVFVLSGDDGGGDDVASGSTGSAGTDDQPSGSTGSAGSDDDAGGTSGTSSGPEATSGPAGPLSAADASASCAAAPGLEADGSTVSYAPLKAVDGDRSTAWRCEGDATGDTLVIDLGGEHHITRVGLLPGYAKTDPTDGTNRYYQNRRITSVDWVFEDGTVVPQTFDPDQAQVQGIGVDATSSTVTVRITGTTAPGSRDFTPIAEVDVIGT